MTFSVSGERCFIIYWSDILRKCPISYITVISWLRCLTVDGNYILRVFPNDVQLYLNTASFIPVKAAQLHMKPKWLDKNTMIFRVVEHVH